MRGLYAKELHSQRAPPQVNLCMQAFEELYFGSGSKILDFHAHTNIANKIILLVATRSAWVKNFHLQEKIVLHGVMQLTGTTFQNCKIINQIIAYDRDCEEGFK